MSPKKQGLVLLAAAALVLWASPVAADYNDAPPALTGWTRSPGFLDDTAEGHGVLLAGSPVTRSSPVIADIDGNSSNGKEVAVGGEDGMLYVYKADGTLLWSVDTLPTGCSSHRVHSMPAVGELYGDGVPYVVVTYDASDCDGGAAAYDGRDGQLKWRFSLLAWRTSENYPAEGLYGAISSPALADTEGDGTLEVAFGGLDRNLYLLSHDGTVRWYYHAADTIYSSPVFMNVDDDGPLELVVGTDISANPAMDPPTTDGGYVYAFNTRARSTARIDFGGGYVWRTSNLGQAIYSSPAVGDVLDTNSGDEIVIGSGCYFPAGYQDKTGKWVKILRPSDGAVLQTLEVPTGGTCVQSSPALGDIDDDGKLEIVVTMGSTLDTGGDGLGRIVAWDPETTAPKWSTVPYSPHLNPGDAAGNDGDGGDLQSPVIADLDGNGSLEVIAANFWTVHVLAGADGSPLTCQDNTCGTLESLFGWGTLKSTPAVGDIDGDGDLEVVIGGMHVYAPPGRGLIYAWTDMAGVLGSSSGTQSAYSAPWPTFRSNPMAPGSAEPPEPPETPTTPSDPCAAYDDDSYEGIACEIDALLDDPPCELIRPIQRKMTKASTALATAPTAKPRKGERLTKRARRQLTSAWRKAGRSLRLTEECQTSLRDELWPLIESVEALLDPA